MSEPDARRRTPDESTAALASSVTAPAGSGSEGDVSPLQPGETLVGRFTVLRFIAQGGMGAVYEANDSVLRTRVALKLIRRRIAQDSGAMERFRREVLLARAVSHPNVCRVYELYEATTASGEPIQFLTMELLRGETLARRLAREGRLRTADALPLVRQMCAGLAAAHAEGVIHRDFKSSNVMLVPRADASGEPSTRATRVAITDFGVARALSMAAGEGETEQPLTGRGILGTPEYMAPEQVTGGEVTAATDVYALGVVLYEMVTGKLPFRADTPLATAARRLNEAPPRPETTVPRLDRRWAAVIVRCLSRHPERRFQNPGEVLAALEGRPARFDLRLPRAVLAAILLLAGAYGAFKAVRSLRSRAPERGGIALPVGRTKVAVIGVRNAVPSPELAWLPPAVTELVRHELAGAESSLRVMEQRIVDNKQRSLGVSAEDLREPRNRARLQALLDSDIFVQGTLSAPGPDGVRLELEVLEPVSGKVVATHEEELGPGGTRLIQGVASAGNTIRERLGAVLSPEEETALGASRAHTLEAARAYAEGFIERTRWNLDGARAHFEAAIAADARFVEARRELALLWEHQTNWQKAREEWKRIQAIPAAFTTRGAAVIDLHASPGQDKLMALFEAAPDDLEVAYMLLSSTLSFPPRTATELLNRIRQLRAGPPVGMEVLEAVAAVESGDRQRSDALLVRAAARATELGARWELARARMFQARYTPVEDPRRRHEALERFDEAERLFQEMGELDDLADTRFLRGGWLGDAGAVREALIALDDAAGMFRRLGVRSSLAWVLLRSADHLRRAGELARARQKLEEGRRELEVIEAPPRGGFVALSHRLRAWLDLDGGDLQAARAAILEARKTNFADQAELLEANVLREEDRPEEARAAYLKSVAPPGDRVAGDCAIDCEGKSPAAGLACLAQKCRTDDPALVGLRRASCRLEEARCRLRVDDVAGAERAAREAAAFLAGADYFELALLSRTTLMQAAAARGDAATAIQALRSDLVKLEEGRNRRLALETALALGTVELGAGRPAGRPRLEGLESQARSLGFLRIARLAAEARERKPPRVAPGPH